MKMHTAEPAVDAVEGDLIRLPGEDRPSSVGQRDVLGGELVRVGHLARHAENTVVGEGDQRLWAIA